MKAPYFGRIVLASLSPNACKALLVLCDLQQGRRWVRSTAARAAQIAQFAPATWRAATAELVAAGLVVCATGPRGFTARVRPSDRFSYVPSFPDQRVAQMSPRACKAFLALCRAFSNRSGSVKMRLTTLADRMGRSVRTASLALEELVTRCMVTVYRTGRASWIVLRKPSEGDRRLIAHQLRAGLRVLWSTPRALLSRPKVPRGTAAAKPASLFPMAKRLVRAGIASLDAALLLVREHGESVVWRAIEIAVGRGGARMIYRALASGWCSG